MQYNHCCNIPTLFEAQAEQSPNAIAVLLDGQSMTYGELNAKSNQYAYYLRDMGVKADVLVGLCMERSMDLLIAMLGILKAGGAYVPLDPSHPIQRLLFVLDDINTPVLITQVNLKENFKRYHGQLVVSCPELELKISTYPKHNLNQDTKPEHLAYVIYTSGSTGVPKGVLIEHASVVNYGNWFSNYTECKPRDRIDFSSNHTFDMAVTTSVVALMLGLTVVICQDEIKKNPSHYFNYLEKYRVNIVKITPSYFKVLLHALKNEFFTLHHLQSIILGGENLLAVDCIAWHSLYPEHILFNEYGPTEATVAVASRKVSQNSRLLVTGSVPIGTPGPNMACYILDADYNPVPDGEIGELYIGGACLARGYLNQPGLTHERFIKNPLDKEDTRLYKTGDLCRRLPDGEIEYIERVDYQVKIRGFRIELAEIERCLVKHPAILDAIVLTRENSHHEKQLIAYYILNADSSSFDLTQIRQYLNMELPYYMIPTAFVRVDYFPLTENGKLDREALPIPQFFTNQHYCAPRTRLEKKLAAIWSEELSQKIVGIESDFFELGGYSLSAARVISSIASHLGKEITLQDFYEAGTIKKLVPIVKMAPKKQKKVRSRFLGLNSKPLFPLSDFQLLIWLCNNFEPNAQKVNIVIRKRLQGRLDKDALLLAFNMVFKKHEVLFYRIFRFRPAQRIQQNLPFAISERDLESISEQDSELTLNASISELHYYHPWPKNKPMLLVRLFRLQDNIDELQIAISHLVADHVSSEILLNDLSKFYLLCCNGHSSTKRLKVDMNHREYISLEQTYLQTHFDKDIVFWQTYLNDACLFAFPKENVVENRALYQFPYSTYLAMPEHIITKLQQFCSENCVSVSDGLTAALLLALSSCCDITPFQTKPIFISRVKSTRDNPIYDNTIGCFLRVEAIKLIFNKTHSMASLSSQIHQVSMETSSHQQLLSLIKIASVSTFYEKRKCIRNYMIKVFSCIYTNLFKKLQLNSQVFNSCGRLFLYERDNHFLININVQPNLILNEERKNNVDLFGLKTKPIMTYPVDLLKAENVFDVCFLRDDNQNTPYIVISAKLKPLFRQQIAKKIIQIIDSGQWGEKHNQAPTQSISVDETLIK